MLLSGHRHDPQVRAKPDTGFLDFATGCLYQHDHYENACTAITAWLDAVGTVYKFEIRFRAWNSEAHWHDDNSRHVDVRDGRLRWCRPG
jgi:hypothetical protein